MTEKEKYERRIKESHVGLAKDVRNAFMSKRAVFGYSKDEASILEFVKMALPLEKGEYLVVMREGDRYMYQNSNWVKAHEKVEEAVKSGEMKEIDKEIERLSKELGLDVPSLETIKVFRYKPRKI